MRLLTLQLCSCNCGPLFGLCCFIFGGKKNSVEKRSRGIRGREDRSNEDALSPPSHRRRRTAAAAAPLSLAGAVALSFSSMHTWLIVKGF